MTTYDVSTLAELNSAIEAVDAAAAGSGAQTIDIASGTISVTSALEAINPQHRRIADDRWRLGRGARWRRHAARLLRLSRRARLSVCGVR
jgi:hypothetical protein